MKTRLLCIVLLARAFVFPAVRGVDVPDKPSPVQSLIDQSSKDLAAGNLAEAAQEVTQALALDPKNVAAHDLRGNIYIRQKLWDRAERDFTELNQISPDPAYRYKLAEIPFLKKDYGNARPRFAALQSEPHLGDLATYKVFLCDMLGGHETLAGRELATLDPAGSKASPYFCRAAWYLFHGQRNEAMKIFEQTGTLFDARTNELYIGSLRDAQRFRPDVATFVTKEGRRFAQSSVFLENDGLRVAGPKGWQTLPLDQLPDDLAPFPEEVRNDIARRRAGVAQPTAPTPLLTFTSSTGKAYEQVRWALTDSGLNVLTPNGWVKIPFDQLPGDLSSFPEDVQRDLQEKRKVAATADRVNVLTFTTRAGKKYENVRGILSDGGILVLTPEGWITISTQDLPSDLSAFPSSWRAQLTQKSSPRVASSSGMTSLSFTTRDGHQYQDVRAAMGKEGLRLLTPDGWQVIAYAQLPADLSSFPTDWREKIKLHQQEPPPSGPNGKAKNTLRGI